MLQCLLPVALVAAIRAVATLIVNAVRRSGLK